MTQTDTRPHSRACGMRRHDHGPDCHSNCPTCGGRAEAHIDDGTAPTVPIESLPPVAAHMTAPITISLQQAVGAYTRAKFPSHDIWRRLAKLGEEVGELNRALIGIDEGRPGRGDPEQEAAQALIVLMSIADLLGFDLLTAAQNEFERVVGIRPAAAASTTESP